MTMEARDLSVGYDGRTVLEGIDLTLRPGSLLALLGPNGSGKSTLLASLCGLLTPQAGTVSLDGRPLSSLRRLALARQVALVPQATAFTLPFRVDEVVLMGRYPHLGRFGQLGPGDREAARRAMATVGLEGFEDRLVNTLSGGEVQRVTLARALAQETGTLLLDEPTSALDPGHVVDVTALLARLRDEGRAIAVALHDVNLALRLADVIAFLRDGALVRLCGPGDVDGELLRQVYGVSWRVGTWEGIPIALPRESSSDAVPR